MKVKTSKLLMKNLWTFYNKIFLLTEIEISQTYDNKHIKPPKQTQGKTLQTLILLN